MGYTESGGVGMDMTNENDPMPGKNVVPFGKHKGKDIVELIEADPNYISWLVNQEWFRNKFVTLHQTIINRGTETEETPEHNALQVMFLDDDFCRRFCEPLYEKRIMERLDKIRKHDKENVLRDAMGAEHKLKSATKRLLTYNAAPELQGELERECTKWYERERDEARAEIQRCAEECDRLDKPITRIDFKCEREFEQNGVDVKLVITARSLDPVISDMTQWLASIEIKPVVGDDYPAVLRQMKRNGSWILFLKHYAGVGATREQFIQTFKASGFRVVFLEQVEQAG